MAPPRTFGERIRFLRLRRGMKQNELARRLRISKVAVCRYEKDTARPRTKHLRGLTRILECRIE